MSGFTYNGIHCGIYGVEYVPDASAKWWEEADFEIYKKDVAWRNGGYYYGNAANIRQIDLNCYFEEVSMATREKIRRWLGRDTAGKLILDDRPFVYYNVRPSKVVPGKIYLDTNETYSGTFTVSFIAEEPFGYLMRKSNDGTENDGAEDYCGLIATSLMPSAPTTSSRNFDVYNPGTEDCGLTIRISGSCSKPIRFINSRNATECVIDSLPSSNLILDIDGETGFVKTYSNNAPNNYSPGFAYHDHGIVRLFPNTLYEDVPYVATVNGTGYSLALTGVIVSEDMIGGSIRFNNPTTRRARVNDVNIANNQVICTVSGTGAFNTTGTLRMFTINNISIEEKNNNGSWGTPSNLTINSIGIDYKPRLL